MIENDAIVLGVLITVLAGVFYTSNLKGKFWTTFYTIFPSLLLCYFIPALLNWPLGLIDGDQSQLYYVASRYLLPASLIFLCLGTDFKGILNLGSKSLIMFLTASLGIILGGPFALFVVKGVFPDMDAAGELWRGLTTIAGSWIGGGANQAAMKEIFQVGDELFGSMLVVDIICANIWLGFLLIGARQSQKIDRWLKADSSSIDTLERRISDYRASVGRIPTTVDTMVLLAIGFGGVALSTAGASWITPVMEEYKTTLEAMKLNALTSSFFWLVVFATTIGLVLSFSQLRRYEGVGSSRFGTIFIYILVATIGMKMDLSQVFNNLDLFAIGIIWMLFHVSLLLLVAKLIRAPFFFVAVGSQANVGGAASAPVVAAAFSPSLAPVGVLMAVLGYALGTYGALVCAYLMQSLG